MSRLLLVPLLVAVAAAAAVAGGLAGHVQHASAALGALALSAGLWALRGRRAAAPAVRSGAVELEGRAEPVASLVTPLGGEPCVRHEEQGEQDNWKAGSQGIRREGIRWAGEVCR